MVWVAGRTVERGYDSAHQAERRRWERIIQLQPVQCQSVACLRPGVLIAAGDEWDLGHTVDRTAWTGPEHPDCNRAEGGRRGRASQLVTRLPWPS